jgi:hypothetical protein
MTIQEFSHKYNFKSNDRNIASRVYASVEMTEKEWIEKLKSEFAFDSSSYVEIADKKASESAPKKTESNTVIDNSTESDESEDVEDEESEEEVEKEDKPLTSKEEKLAKIKSNKTSHKK